MGLSTRRNRHSAHFAELTGRAIPMSASLAGDLERASNARFARVGDRGGFSRKALHGLQRFRDSLLAGVRPAHIGLQAIKEFIHMWTLAELVPRTSVGQGCGWPGSWFLGIHDRIRMGSF